MPNKNLKTKLENLIPENILTALYLCSEAAETCSLNIFLIGGIVRDIIREKNNFDIDITVQGNAVEFAEFLEKNYPARCKVKEIHEKFKTAKVIFLSEENHSCFVIDLASTRKETYPYPSSLPLVEEIGCELFEDVKRRDFSINSMAISLNKNNFGELIDYLDGYDDLNNKTIRVLHNNSFKDDPTRIIRALKFRERFGYELDKNTKKLQEKCLKSGMFDNLCGERIKSEIKQTFNLNKSKCMEIFFAENIYRLVKKDLKTPKNFSSVYKTCELTVLDNLGFINSEFIWLIYLGIMFSDLSKDKINTITDNLYFSGTETEILFGAKALVEKAELLKYKHTNFEIYEYFEGFSSEAIIIFLIKNPEFKNQINLYLQKLKYIQIYTTGQTLIDLGLKPGVIFGEILKELLKGKINGEFSSEEDETKYLKLLI